MMKDGRLGSRQNVLRALPTDAQVRKGAPIAEGVLDYFPDAIFEVARVSKAGNDQHNPGEPLHWARGKSSDHANCIARHLIERGTRDPLDGMRHSAKLVWRALALLQEELEAEAGFDPTVPREAQFAHLVASGQANTDELRGPRRSEDLWWICEAHPGELYGHVLDGVSCPGPGRPPMPGEVIFRP